jgi:hypothetical protein
VNRCFSQKSIDSLNSLVFELNEAAADKIRKDEDGVDGRGVCGWDGWVCGLGAVGASSIFALVRRTGAFTGGLLTFPLVPGFQLAEHNRGECHFFTAAFPSQLETMVGGALARASALSVGLGVGRAFIASGSRTRPSHSCDGWGGCPVDIRVGT